MEYRYLRIVWQPDVAGDSRVWEVPRDALVESLSLYAQATGGNTLNGFAIIVMRGSHAAAVNYDDYLCSWTCIQYDNGVPAEFYPLHSLGGLKIPIMSNNLTMYLVPKVAVTAATICLSLAVPLKGKEVIKDFGRV